MSAGYFLGIDLGTSYCSAAVAAEQLLAPVSFGEEGTSIPTVLALADDGSWLFGRGANRWAITHPEQVVRDFKRRFGDPTPFRPAAPGNDATTITADQAMFTMYEEILRRVVAQRGSEPDAVAVAHPANWGQFKRDLLRECLSASSHPPAMLVTEPQAAARAELESSQHPIGEETLAMYDLGGGTFDVALLRVSQAGLEPLGPPGGIERLGGLDFDTALWGWTLEQLDLDPAELANEMDPVLQVCLGQLRLDLLEVKHLLSFETTAVVPVHLSSGVRRLVFDRKEFARRISPMIERSVDHLVETIERDGRALESVDRVVLMGGSSNIPAIAESIKSRTNLPIVQLNDPQTAVARGAALHLLDRKVQTPTKTSIADIPSEASFPTERAAIPVPSKVPDATRAVRWPLLAGAGLATLAALVFGGLVLFDRGDNEEAVSADDPLVPVADDPLDSVADDPLDSVADDPLDSNVDLAAFEVIFADPGAGTPFGDLGQGMVFASSGPISPVSQIWEYSELASTWSEILVDGGQIFLTSPGAKDRLVALDLTTGRELWSASDNLVAAPIVVTKTLAMSNIGSSIVAFDRESGASVTLTNPLHTDSQRPWINDGKVVDGVLYLSRDLIVDDATQQVDISAIKLSDAETLWNRTLGPPGQDLTGDIAIADDLIVLSLHDSLVGLDRLTGTELWTTDIPDGVLHITATSDSVIVSTRAEGASENTIIVLDSVNGTVRFSERSHMTTISILDGSLILEVWESDVAQMTGLRGVALSDGSERWRMDLDETESSPTVVLVGPNLAYLISSGGELVAFTTESEPTIAFRSQLDSISTGSNRYSIANGYLVEFLRQSGQVRVYQ